MRRQCSKHRVAGFIRPALAVGLCITTISLRRAEGSETNKLSNWSAGNTPREIGQLVVNYMVPRWQVVSPSDAKVQDFTWLLRYSKKTGDQQLQSRLIDRINPLLKQFEENPECLKRNVDESVFGAVLLEIYIQTSNPRCLASGKMLADRQWQVPQDNGLSRESRFRVEDMYSITMLQLQAFRATAEPVYLDRAALTLSVYLERLQDSTGLFHHGLKAPHYWGRGNGFASVALAMLLSDLPATHAQRNHLMTGYQRMMTAAAQHQGASGMWNQLMDVSDSYAESSCTAMLTYALTVGIQKGWLPRDPFTSAARKGWGSLMDRIGKSGKVYQVSVDAEPSKNAEYYLKLPAQRGDRNGQSAVLWCVLALLEQEQRGDGTGMRRCSLFGGAQGDNGIHVSGSTPTASGAGIPE